MREIMKSPLWGVSAGKMFDATSKGWIFIQFYPTGYALISSHTNFLALSSFCWLMIPTFNLIMKCIDMRPKKRCRKKPKNPWHQPYAEIDSKPLGNDDSS